MKKTVLFLWCCVTSTFFWAQTILFSEDFESGGSSFNLNTSDLGGLSASSGSNQWIVNMAYTGDYGTETCLFSDQGLGDTPVQPAGISSANGNYMHIYSDVGTSWSGAASFIYNCNYMPGNASCSSAQSYFAAMTSDISTTGMTDVELSFWWLCEGNAYAYGEIYYSTDGGTSWTQVTSPMADYNSQTSWVQQTLTDAAFNDQANLRFGFRFVTELDFSGYTMKMAFGIDDVSIVGTMGTSCSDSFSSFTVDACDMYTVPSGDETYTTSGSVMDTIPNTDGCDSIMTIMVNITTIDTGITDTMPTLYSDASGAGVAYQWYNCDLDENISGATDAAFTPMETGNYAVIVTDGSCSDTSACIFVLVEGISENDFGTALKLYPNPTNGIVTINLGEEVKQLKLQVMDVSGRQMTESMYQNCSQISDYEIKGDKGIYFLYITAVDGRRAVMQLVKK